MDNYFVYILLFIVQRFSVNGQMLVSHKDGVIITSSSQTGTDGRYVNEHAIDSSTSTNAGVCRCCAATDPDVNPWYKVDLIQEYMIQRVHILGRTDHPHTLNKLEIQLGTTDSDGAVIHVDTSDTSIDELDYTLSSPEPARYITLTLRDRSEYFIICELYVYAVCFAGLYGPECVNTCGKCQNNDPCDGVTGECPVCTPGYQSPTCTDCIAGRYGSTCELCGQCNSNDVCDKSNGNCPNGCSAGYQGPKCEQECSSGYGLGCAETCGKCKNNAACNNVDGACTACTDGYFSPLCDDCIAGRYGTTCIEECGHCYNNDTCDNSNGNCPSRCSAGYQGNTCKDVCSPGTYGITCSKTCGRCESNAACNNLDGACVACLTGYLSPICKECIDGRYGTACNEACGQCNNSDACDKINANCPNGCSAGFQGIMCKEECEDGTFVLGCQEKCGNCSNNETCNKIDGSCASCAAGFKGNTCVVECQAGTFGFDCKQRCGMCKDGDVCGIYTGECPNGCTDEYKGSQCLQEINQDTSSSSDTSISLPVCSHCRYYNCCYWTWLVVLSKEVEKENTQSSEQRRHFYSTSEHTIKL